MENTVTVVLHMNKKTLELLDKATEHRRSEEPRPLSLVEWNQTPRGKEFWYRLEFGDLKYKPVHEVNRMQREMYREDVPARKGRPKIHDARIAVLHEALEAYLTAKAA